ncbi:MAG: acyl--CoA ligase [Peptococcaceae bacterium]|nr:acyl--CoA ligase [Peptococcaceae bacterium]
MNIDQKILDSIHSIPWDHVFISDIPTGKQYTYKQFVQHALQASAHIKQLNADEIVLLLENRYEMAVFYFAALLGSIKVCPLDVLKGNQEIEKLLSLYPHTLIIDENGLGADFHRSQCLDVKEIDIETTTPLDSDELKTAFDHIQWHKPFLTTYTSGTSGHMKGVEHSAHNLFSSAIAFRDHHKINAANTFYHVMPMAYMAGILNTFIVPFCANARVAIGPRFSPITAASFWTTALHNRLNTFWLSPTMAAMILKMDRGSTGINYTRDTPCLIITATAPLTEKLRHEFQNKYATPLYQSYGLSETLLISSESAAATEQALTCGKPLDGVEITFENGEMLQKTPWTFLRYTNHPTEAYFSGSFYKTGDLAAFSAHGNLTVTGRLKDLIIRGGMNISGKLIEDTVLKLDEVEEAAVFALPDSMMGEKIACAYVQSSHSHSSTRNSENPEEVNRRIHQRILSDLGSAHRIDQLIPCAEIPKNINGKVDRLKLSQQYAPIR